MKLFSRGIWRLRIAFLLPTVIRPAESHKHKELCFGSDHLLLPRHREGGREGGREGVGREGEREKGLKRKRRKRLRAKRGPGKDECQLCLQCPSRIAPSSSSSSPFHPAPSPSSSPSSPLVLHPSSWPVLSQERKTSLMVQTKTSVWVPTENRVAL